MDSAGDRGCFRDPGTFAWLPDLPFAVDRLLNVNQTDIGNAIKPFYGNAAGDQLTALLKIHISEAATILSDLKTSSSNLNADIAAWYVKANDIAVFLNGLNPNNWPLAEAQDFMVLLPISWWKGFKDSRIQGFK